MQPNNFNNNLGMGFNQNMNMMNMNMNMMKNNMGGFNNNMGNFNRNQPNNMRMMCPTCRIIHPNGICPRIGKPALGNQRMAPMGMNMNQRMAPVGMQNQRMGMNQRMGPQNQQMGMQMGMNQKMGMNQRMAPVGMQNQNMGMNNRMGMNQRMAPVGMQNQKMGMQMGMNQKMAPVGMQNQKMGMQMGMNQKMGMNQRMAPVGMQNQRMGMNQRMGPQNQKMGMQMGMNQRMAPVGMQNQKMGMGQQKFQPNFQNKQNMNMSFQQNGNIQKVNVNRIGNKVNVHVQNQGQHKNIQMNLPNQGGMSPQVGRHGMNPQVGLAPPTLRHGMNPQVGLAPPTLRHGMNPQVGLAPPTLRHGMNPQLGLAPPTMRYGMNPQVGLAPPTMRIAVSPLNPMGGIAPAQPTVYDPFGQQLRQKTMQAKLAGHPAEMKQPGGLAVPVSHHKRTDSTIAPVYQEVRGKGTLKPTPGFNAEKDASDLRAAMKGFGCDTGKLIEILSNRTYSERQAIKKSFQAQFSRDLLSDLKSEVSGVVGQSLRMLAFSREEYTAYWVRHSLKGMSVNHDMLIEAICTLTPAEAKHVSSVYEQMFSRNLADDVNSATKKAFGKKSTFRDVLLGVLQAYRNPESTPINLDRLSTCAKMLLKAGESQIKPDYSVFTDIFCKKSFTELRVISKEYDKICAFKLKKSISRKMGTSHTGAALRTILDVASNESYYWALKLREAMRGLGCDKEEVARVMISRADIDLADIASQFKRNSFGNWNGKSLSNWLSSEVSGDFMKICTNVMAGTD